MENKVANHEDRGFQMKHIKLKRSRAFGDSQVIPSSSSNPPQAKIQEQSL
jgi:hypothetical protein